MPDDKPTPVPAPSPEDDDSKNSPPDKENIIHLHGPKEPPPEPEMEGSDATDVTDADKGVDQEGDSQEAEVHASDSDGQGGEAVPEDPTPPPSSPDDDENKRPVAFEDNIELQEPPAQPATGAMDADEGERQKGDSPEPEDDASDGDGQEGEADASDHEGQEGKGDDSDDETQKVGDGIEENDDLDVEPWDELDEAAAAHKEDWRRPTEPWPEPVDGEALFAALVLAFHRFLVLPEGAAEVLALWTITTYALHVSDLRFAVRIMITAPGANSGKTTLLDLLTYLVRRPDPTSDITPASLFRSLNDRKTVLIDEADHTLPSRAGTRNELVAMINVSHKRTSGVVIRTENLKTPNGTIKVTRRYPIFAPIAMAGIGDFAPPTIKTRAFIIKLMRMMVSEKVVDFITDEHAPMMRELRSKIFRWVKDNKDAIRYCRPELDRDLMNNRQRDNATMFLQIADTIGPRCASQAREAIKIMTGGDTRDTNEMLLCDTAAILTDPEILVGDPPKPIGTDNTVFSGDLCDLIVKYFPHREIYQGFTQARLASMLRVFDIEPEPRGKWQGKREHNLRWYRRDAFDPWFIRYGLIEQAEETIVDSLPEGATDDAHSEGATPLKEETERSSVAPPTASAPAPVAETPAPQQAAPQEGMEPATAPAESASSPTGAPEMAYPNARVVPEGPGEKKRLKRLRREIERLVLAGAVDAADVAYITSRFWVITRGGERYFVHMDGDKLEWLSIAAPGLLAKDGVIRIGPVKTLRVSDGDFLILRPMVNKYRKLSVQ